VKCHFCESRQKDKQAPACAELCPTNALDFSFEEIDKSQIPASIPLSINPNPSLKITELHKKEGPEMDLTLFEPEDLVIEEKENKEIGAQQEWPLLVFTFIIAVMVALTAAGANEDSAEGLKWGMCIAGAIGALMSGLHLGKKFRMWRAVLNLKHSWLSREVFFFGLYYILMLTDFFVLDVNYYIVLLPGALTLFSIDMLYTPVQQKWKIPFHSGQSIIISISLMLLLFKFYWILLAFMLLRMSLQVYAFHPLDEPLFKNKGFLIRWAMIDISIILVLFAVPFPIIFGLILLGEFLDRLQFYNHLHIQKIINQ